MGEPLGICWCTQTPTPYNDDLFRGLEADSRFRLLAFYAQRTSKDHPWQEPVGEGYSSSTLSSFQDECRLYWLIVSRQFDTFIFAGWGTRQYMIGIILASLFRVPYFLFTDTPKFREGKSIAFEFLRKQFLMSALGRSSGLLATGKLAMQRLVALGYTKAPVFNLPYSLDENRFPVGGVRRDSQEIRIVSSGRLVNRLKGFDVGLHALAMALKQLGPETSLTYTIVGSGPDAEELDFLIERLELTSCVLVVPWMSQKDLSETYRLSDIYLHPARFEPYGVTVVEALYSGLFAICSSSTGAAVELIEDNVNGILCAPEDQRAFADAIRNAVQIVSERRITKDSVRSQSLKWPLSRCIETVHKVVSDTLANV